MSYNTLNTQVRDQALADRVNAAAHQEALNNPAVADSAVAAEILRNTYGADTFFIWPVSAATEAEYASALAAGTLNPGGDEAVISDGQILSAVQANWPPDPT